MSRRAFYAWEAMKRKLRVLDARVHELEAFLRDLGVEPPIAVTCTPAPRPRPVRRPRKVRAPAASSRQVELFP